AFDAFVDLQHRGVAPPRIIGSPGPVVEIITVPARPDQTVDAAPPTHHLAHWQRRRATIQCCAGLGTKLPVTRAADILHPDPRIACLRHPSVSTGLTQPHSDCWMGR